MVYQTQIRLKLSKLIKTLLTLFTIIIVLSACESNFKDVQKINFSEFVPSGEADDFNLKYTDSGKIKSILISPKMLDYSNVEFPFTEFPKGINVTMYDESAKRTFIKANYAISFKGTDIIDLQGQVSITTESGQKLETEQLYFDQKNEWFHSQKPFKLSAPNGVSYGEGIDFSKDFKIVNSQRVKGQINNAK
jgi:LPS export ABC transporter protein LptC